MKRIPTISLSATVLLLTFYAAARSQTITLDSLSASTFCTGDPVSVTFTATGVWGHKNAFTVQLSDASGSFETGFSNLGSLLDTIAGTFTIQTSIPSVSTSTHYRIRVIAANPYSTSSDNGTDISISPLVAGPYVQMNLKGSDAFGLPMSGTAAGLAEEPLAIQFKPASNADTLNVDFGADATPSTAHHIGWFVDSVTYATGGVKVMTINVSRAVGCPSAAVYRDTFRVFDCTTPSIPHSAIVVDIPNPPEYLMEPHSYWIDPGVSCTFVQADYDTIYVEPGANVTGSGNGTVIYAKQGSVINFGSEMNTVPIIIYADSANVPKQPGVFKCSSLSFDYTTAAPNVVMHINDNEAVAPADISAP